MSLNELTTLIADRLAALLVAVANQDDKVSRLENMYDAAIPRDKRKIARRLIKARLLLERVRGRLQEAEKTYILIKAHELDNAKDGPNE